MTSGDKQRGGVWARRGARGFLRTAHTEGSVLVFWVSSSEGGACRVQGLGCCESAGASGARASGKAELTGARERGREQTVPQRDSTTASRRN
ncbi:hypothetical protein JZ751_005004 [Albula glossodonta]|uniref:Uncharacterized protein n=1 Tax=Albula glossodonta TaxID=121402 RepID=A0A8T2PF88_9TELE|nr:hypothetical protein JZ751_005004 [Albula glossodonta]